jgi:MFS superfamily sulfate permease-like transporter
MLAHIPMAALAGVTAWMGLYRLYVSAWRRLPRMRLVDAGGFLATAIGILIVNAVTAVLAVCTLDLIQYLYRRHLGSPSGIPGMPDITK